MNKLLYVYDSIGLNLLKEQLSNYNFITLNTINRKCKDSGDVWSLELSDHIIDLTNFFHDTSINRFYRSALEDYVVELNEEFKDIKFIIKIDKLDDFNSMYPYLFDESEIVYYTEDKKEGKRRIDYKNNHIYFYKEKNIINVNNIEGNIINFSQLVNNFNGINVSVNYEIINSEEQNYIDISTVIEFLKYRKDQVFVFEIIFNKLAKQNIKYLINEKLIEVVDELFPLTFSSPQELTSLYKTNIISTKVIDDVKESTFLINVDSIMEQLSLKLKGHGEFKKKLKADLIKFKYLNKIDRRKIMSIFICGKSGVGKTEFARLLSKIMYPNTVQIKLNFGNYSTEGVLNSLIGSPLGYVGSEKGGELINKVRESESKVILIDEFEKADGKVFNFFYELLEDGKFTDRAGNEHDLDGYIIIFTSNLNIKSYHKNIPEPLDSRFDMKYFFQPLNSNEKADFIKDYSSNLINDLKYKFKINLNVNKINRQIMALVVNDNLREIKRRIEDIVISELNLRE